MIKYGIFLLGLIFSTKIVAAPTPNPAAPPVWNPNMVVGEPQILNSCSISYKGIIKSPVLAGTNLSACNELDPVRNIWATSTDESAASNAATTLFNIATRILDRNYIKTGFYFQAKKSAERICRQKNAFLTFTDKEDQVDETAFFVKKSYCQKGPAANQYQHHFHYRCMQCNFIIP